MDMWYAVERLSPTQHGQLTRQGIPYAVTPINRPILSEVTAVPGEFRDRLIEILDMGAATEQPTNLDNTMLLVRGIRHNVLQHMHESDCNDLLLPTLQWFADKIGMDVETSNPHGYTELPRSELGKFFIFYWSSSTNNGRSSIQRCFGTRLTSGQHDAMAIGSGIPVIDDEGITVAELSGSNLYILFDLPHSANGNPEILRKILEAASEMIASPDEYNRIARERTLELERGSRDRYIAACGSRGQSDLTGERDTLARLRRENEGYAEALTRTIRDIDRSRARISVLESLPSRDESYGTEFDKLKTSAHVDTVIVQDDKIIVTTDHLATYPLRDGRIADLGIYRIVIPVGSGIPTAHNLTRSVRGFGHPHSHGGGDMCYGNIGSDLATLMGKFEFSLAAQLVIEFLQTINEADDYGKRVRDWPTASATPVTRSPVIPVATPSEFYPEEDEDEDYYDEEDEDEDYDDEDEDYEEEEL